MLNDRSVLGAIGFQIPSIHGLMSVGLAKINIHAMVEFRKVSSR